MTEVIVTSHKEINALAFRHSKSAASCTVLHIRGLGVEFIVKQVSNVLEELVDIGNVGFEYLVQFVVLCVVDFI